VSDVTPLVPAGRKLITAYGDGGFKIAGEAFTGSVLVFPEQVLAWDAALTAESLAPVAAAKVEILLIGCGSSMAFIAPELRATLRQSGVVIDAMDTGAAARTFNVLLAEGRKVAAALVAVP
jgi:uncharacterized protein